MDWRDLLAWQNVQTRLVTMPAVVGLAVPLADQNPHRIYLAFSQQDGDDPHRIFPGNASVAGAAGGYTIGGARFWPNPFDIEIVTLHTVYDPSGSFSDTTGTIETHKSAIAAVPQTLEFFADRHGALVQQPWWIISDGCPARIYVVQVIQDEAPCDRKPKVVPRGRFVRGLWLPQCNQPDGSSGDNLDADSGGQQPPLRPDSQPDITQPLLDLLRRAGGVSAGVDLVPRDAG